MSAAEPIFVRGMSRSGGTLLVTILDAHPAIAMSYELYPELLALDDASPGAVEAIAEDLAASEDIRGWARGVEPGHFRTFIVRCERSGLTNQDMARLLGQQAAGGGLEDRAAQLEFVERCCATKAERTGKSRWGAKCNQSFDEYLERWPGTYFLNVVRDGRDVLASQQNTGAFKNTPEQVARGWSRTHQLFRGLVENDMVRAHEVRYERLVADPVAEIEAVTDFLGLQFEASMLDYHRAELTIFGATHLSMERITKPVDDSQVGRWRRDLSKEDLQRFEEVAGDMMRTLGYEPGA